MPPYKTKSFPAKQEFSLTFADKQEQASKGNIQLLVDVHGSRMSVLSFL